MKLINQITIIRRYLRDPDSRLWDNDLLVDLWNQVQDDLFAKLKPIEDVRALPVPPRFQASYMHIWEYEYLAGTQNFQCLLGQNTEYRVTGPWEVQEFVALSGDAPATGGYCTHPFEAWQGFVTDEFLWMIFPADYHQAIGVYYDEEPLEYASLKAIQSDDPSWRGRRGSPWCYTRLDELGNQFALFPAPEALGVEDEYTPTDPAIAMEDDTDTDVYGTIVRRSGSVLSDNLGYAQDIVETADNVFLWYRQRPAQMTGTGDEMSWPDYLVRYIRYGVLAQAYESNNDGKIASLRDFWGRRYKLGIEAFQMFLRMRKADRNYRLTTSEPGYRDHVRHPRLPDTYPPI